MLGNVFGRYAARAPGALPQLRTFSSRLGSTTQHVLPSSSTSTKNPSTNVPSSPHLTLPSNARSLHTSLAFWEEFARRRNNPRTRAGGDDRAAGVQRYNAPSPYLYVKHLPLETTEEEIRKLVSEVAEVEDFELRMLRTPSGEFRGAAFLDFKSVEEATLVKRRLLNAEHDIGDLGVNFSTGPRPRDIMEDPTNSVFVGFKQKIDEEELATFLKDKFQGVKEIRFADVIFNGAPASRAFIDFETIPLATAAEAALNDAGSVGATAIARCNFARSRKDVDRRAVEPTNRLYIRDLPVEDVEGELRSIFRKHQGIQELFFSQKPDQKWALAYYDSVDNATKALKAVKDLVLSGSNRPIKVKYGTSRTEPKTGAEGVEFA